MTTDRAALERAIELADETLAGFGYSKHPDLLKALRDAAAKYLDTLPRTRMVERFHLEGWHPLEGPWVQVHGGREEAEIKAKAFRDAGVHTCVRVTGPHLHEVPSDSALTNTARAEQ